MNKEELHATAVAAAAKDRAGGSSTGEFDPRYTREDLERSVDLAFIRGFKAGATHQLDKDCAVLAKLDEALVNLYALWRPEK